MGRPLRRSLPPRRRPPRPRPPRPPRPRAPRGRGTEEKLTTGPKAGWTCDGSGELTVYTVSITMAVPSRRQNANAAQLGVQHGHGPSMWGAAARYRQAVDSRMGAGYRSQGQLKPRDSLSPWLGWRPRSRRLWRDERRHELHVAHGGERCRHYGGLALPRGRSLAALSPALFRAAPARR